MTDRRPIGTWNWTSLLFKSGGALCLIVCGCLVLSRGVAAEKKTEGGVKSDAAAEKSEKSSKPPLGQITILVPEKKFRPEGPNKALRVGFDDIDIEKVLNTKTLTLDIPKKMPDWMRDLDGKRIRIRGFINPTSVFQETGNKYFVLCRDTSACCFGPNPTVFYLVETNIKDGKSADFTDKAVDVEGIFRIKPSQVEEKGKKSIDRFYSLEDAEVVKK
jgi:hypothetical protein